jgi:hypothetical protein
MWPTSFGVVKHPAGRARALLGHGGYQDALALEGQSFSRMLPTVIGGPGGWLGLCVIRNNRG